MFRRRWFSSPKTERRYFFSTNQGSCDIYADGVYVGRYLGTGITEFTYSTSRNYINISLVGISLPDQVYNYTNGIITDSLAIYQGSTTYAKYTAIFDAEIYETIPVTNAMTGFVEDKLPGQAYYAYMLDNELRTGVGDFTIV